jgi:hypothetical protein
MTGLEVIPENETRSYQVKFVKFIFNHSMSNIWWIQCEGNRTFIIDNILHIILLEVFLGLFAIDKFSLGHIGVVVGKIITLVQAKRNFFDFFL